MSVNLPKGRFRLSDSILFLNFAWKLRYLKRISKLSMKVNSQKKNIIWRKVFRIVIRMLIAFVFVLSGVVVTLNIPSVQTFIFRKFIQSVSQKTGTTISLGKVKIAIPNTISIEDLFLNDRNADTLLYMHSLKVRMDLFGLLHNKINVDSLRLDQVVAHIHRNENEKVFNFQFIIDVFTPDSASSVDKTKKQGRPWELNLKDIYLRNIHANFQNFKAGFDGRFKLGELNIHPKTIDFPNKKLSFGEIDLKNTQVQLVLGNKENNLNESNIISGKTATNNYDYQSQSETNIFIPLSISVDQLTVQNTDFSLDNESHQKIIQAIDYQHLDISDLNGLLANINIDSAGYRANIKNLSLNENSGMDVKNFSANANVTDRQMEVSGLFFETSKSKISGDASLNYASFNAFLSDFENTEIALNVMESDLEVNDIFMFAPTLATNTELAKFKNSDILLSLQANGKMNDLNIENMEGSVLDHTAFKTKGKLTGLPDVGNMHFDATIDHFSTSMKEVYQFVDPAVFAEVKMPSSFSLEGRVKGKVDSLSADIQLRSAYGNIAADAYYARQIDKESDTFNIGFTTNKMLAGIILSDSMLGEFSFSGSAAGSGLTKGKRSGTATLTIQEAQYNHYSYNNIHIKSWLNGNLISAIASSADTNLNFRLIADADLNDVDQKYTTRLDLTKLDLKSLHFTEEKIAVSTNMVASLHYAGLDNAEIDLEFTNSSIQKDEKYIPVKEMKINVLSVQDTTKIELISDFADGILQGNMNIENIQKTLNSAYNRYIGIADTSQLQPDNQLDLHVDIHIPQSMIDSALPELDSLRIGKLEGNYKSSDNELQFDLQMPKAIYSDLQIDSLGLAIWGKNETLSMDLQLKGLIYNKMRIENFRVQEQLNRNKISSVISILDSSDKPSYFISNEIASKNNQLIIRFLPNGLMLDGTSWHVPEENIFEIKNGVVSSREFIFSNKDQSIGFIAGENNIQLAFSNFALQNMINIARFDGLKELINGNINGEIYFPIPGNQGFVDADLKIDSLYFRNLFAGNLLFNIKTTMDKMDVNAHLLNDENKLSITGSIDHLSSIPNFDLNLLLDFNNLSRIQKFSFETLSQLKGKIDGALSIKGTIQNPDLNGMIRFEETNFKINSLNFQAIISDDKILIGNHGLHFDDFIIADTFNKKLTVNGDIFTNNFTNPGFDLHLDTKDFQPMNSTSADNPKFYGKLSLATDVWLKGDLKNPDVEAQVEIDSATNLIYVLPGSEIKIVSPEGIVRFLEPGQRYDSIYTLKVEKSLADSIMSRISGINLAVDLEIDQNAKFTVDIDPNSGDYLTVGGNAKMRIAVDKSGKQSINGIYEVKSGLYELSFYNLVKKTFVISPGSTISWTGNPKDADVNIKAKYTVTTPSTALMTVEAITMSESEKNMFKQRLPYEVNLNILGFLSEPIISFSITLPDKYLNANPMIASRLTVLNSEDHVDQLNKQVFALLVTGSFIPDNTSSTGGSSASNVATTAARNGVNDILAGQMNNVSNKYIRNVDVNFGLTTFDTEATSSSNPTTELDVKVSKKMFDERFTVEAQSSIDMSGNKKTSTTTSDHNSGEFAVIYKLDRKGEYKMKVYSQTAYDLFDGDIVASGIAVIFQKQFDSLKRKKKTEVNSEMIDKQNDKR